MYAFLLLFAFQLTTSSAQLPAKDRLLVYDAVADATIAKRVNRSDQAIFNSQLLPAARRAWRSRQEECVAGWEGKPEILGVAVGSFTKPLTAQRAILYNYCTPAHAYAFHGLAVIENGRVIVHYAYQSDWQGNIAAAPDVNSNGLAEIILVSGTTNQGTTWSAITIVELSGSTVQKLGFTDVFSDNCGYDERSGAGEARKLFVNAGANPQFFRDTFKRGCNQTRWRRVKQLEAVTLSEDPTDYRSLK